MMTDWRKGDRIIVNYGEPDEFYMGTVLQVRRAKIRVQYDGYDWIDDLSRTHPYIQTSPHIFGRSTYEAKCPGILTKRQAMRMLEGSDDALEPLNIDANEIQWDQWDSSIETQTQLARV